MFKKLLFYMLVLFTFVSCSTPAKVTDTETGKVYYTDWISGPSGVFMFKDKKTGDLIQLDSYRLKWISEEELEDGLKDID